MPRSSVFPAPQDLWRDFLADFGCACTAHFYQLWSFFLPMPLPLQDLWHDFLADFGCACTAHFYQLWFFFLPMPLPLQDLWRDFLADFVLQASGQQGLIASFGSTAGWRALRLCRTSQLSNHATCNCLACLTNIFLPADAIQPSWLQMRRWCGGPWWWPATQSAASFRRPWRAITPALWRGWCC